MATFITQLTTVCWRNGSASGNPFLKYKVEPGARSLLTVQMIDDNRVMGVPGPYPPIPGAMKGAIEFTASHCPSGVPGGSTYDVDLFTGSGHVITPAPGSGLGTGYEHLNGVANDTNFHRYDTHPAGIIYPVDFRVYSDQLYQEFQGALGNLTLTFKNDDWIKANWRFEGMFLTNPSEGISAGGSGQEAEGAGGTGQASDTPIPAINMVADIGGVTEGVVEVVLDTGNNILLLPDITSPGYNEPVITITRPTLRCKFVHPQLGISGANDFWARLRNQEDVAVTVTFGDALGHTGTLDFYGRIKDSPEITDEGGVLYLTITLMEIPDQPYTLTYT